MGQEIRQQGNTIHIALVWRPQPHAQARPGHKKVPQNPAPTARQKRHHMPSPSLRKQPANPSQVRVDLMNAALRRQCSKKLALDDKTDFSKFEKDRSTLISVVTDVANKSGIPYAYLMATIYAESRFKNKVTPPTKKNPDPPQGLAQIKKIAWNEFFGPKKNYRYNKHTMAGREKFIEIWSQMAPGVKRPSGPGISPLADVVFMAAWSVKRSSECGLVTIDDETKKNKAMRLCYHRHADARFYVSELLKNKKLNFPEVYDNENWEAFVSALVMFSTPTLAHL